MGTFRERIKRWDFAITAYVFMMSAIHLIRFGFVDPPEYIEVPEKQSAYINIPKAACSSFKASITNRNFPDDYSVHTAIGGKFRFSRLNSDYFVFSFVRNPFDRLASCYESKFHRDAAIKKPYLAYKYYLLGILSKDLGFEHFIKTIYRIPERLAEKHFRSQHSSLYRHGKCVADFVGKFENLETDYEPIRQKYGFAPLKHYNKTDKGNWMDYYTPKTAKMVYRKYRKDFETFGYQDEYEKLLKYLAAKEEKSVHPILNNT